MEELHYLNTPLSDYTILEIGMASINSHANYHAREIYRYRPNNIANSTLKSSIMYN